MQATVLAYGTHGLLTTGLSDPERASLLNALCQRLPTGCTEYIEGYDSVLFLFRHPTPSQLLEVWLDAIDPESPPAPKGRKLHRIPVQYNGPDLEAVAEASNLDIDEVITIHSGAHYTVRMMGFTPGFPYLDGLDPRLHLARRDSPRKRIEPGAVAIGGPHAGVYSVASPGGWHLLGHTESKLFQPELAKNGANPPSDCFLLSPGDEVLFHKVD